MEADCNSCPHHTSLPTGSPQSISCGLYSPWKPAKRASMRFDGVAMHATEEEDKNWHVGDWSCLSGLSYDGSDCGIRVEMAWWLMMAPFCWLCCRELLPQKKAEM